MHRRKYKIVNKIVTRKTQILWLEIMMVPIDYISGLFLPKYGRGYFDRKLQDTRVLNFFVWSIRLDPAVGGNL